MQQQLLLLLQKSMIKLSINNPNGQYVHSGNKSIGPIEMYSQKDLSLSLLIEIILLE